MYSTKEIEKVREINKQIQDAAQNLAIATGGCASDARYRIEQALSAFSYCVPVYYYSGDTVPAWATRAGKEKRMRANWKQVRKGHHAHFKKWVMNAPKVRV